MARFHILLAHQATRLARWKYCYTAEEMTHVLNIGVGTMHAVGVQVDARTQWVCSWRRMGLLRDYLARYFCILTHFCITIGLLTNLGPHAA